jgi:hypothetical protein
MEYVIRPAQGMFLLGNHFKFSESVFLIKGKIAIAIIKVMAEQKSTHLDYG